MATLDILCTANHGAIQSDNAAYATARSGGTLSADTSATNTIGQAKPANYLCYEGFLTFDGSAIPAGATISGAVLKLYGAGDSSTQDFIINAYVGFDFGAGVTTADWIASGSTAGLTLVATFDTSAGWASAFNSFANVALPANVTKAGLTKITLLSSRHTGNNTPAGDEFVYYEATSVGLEARITVTYTVPSSGFDPMGQNGYFGI